MTKAILAPAAVLVLWTLLVLVWMAIKRFGTISTMRNSSEDRTKLRPLAKPGVRGEDLEAVLPANAMWPSHNYTHLMEQPTLFYAVVLILAVIGQGTGLNLMLAWAYTGLRILHSLWQITVNKVQIRFALFIASTLCLLVLAINAVRATI